jgi:molecular chaperone GrpE
MTPSERPQDPHLDPDTSAPETDTADAAAFSDDIPMDDGGEVHGTLDAAHARIAELEAALNALNDKTLRALAEAENTRKRMEKERQDTAKFAVSSFARDLVSVADNLGRALSAITPEQKEQNEPLKNIAIGVEATERELLRALENNGIKRVECLGQPFDPNLHEVMFEIDDASKVPGTILQVLEPAYTIHERLLRPARVGVAKGGTKPEGGHLDENV